MPRAAERPLRGGVLNTGAISSAETGIYVYDNGYSGVFNGGVFNNGTISSGSSYEGIWSEENAYYGTFTAV